jgi:ribosomal-protein-alanine N-acetyltransferase
MIRVANRLDIPAIRVLMQSVPGIWHDAWRPDVLMRALAAAGDLALVHDAAGAIDGFACAHDLGFRAYLSALVVAPAVQGQGIGPLLLTEVERRLADRGCSTLIADVWRDAESFYRRLGWTAPAAILLRRTLGSDRRP